MIRCAHLRVRARDSALLAGIPAQTEANEHTDRQVTAPAAVLLRIRATLSSGIVHRCIATRRTPLGAHLLASRQPPSRGSSSGRPTASAAGTTSK